MCGHSRSAGAVTHTGPIDPTCSATLRPDFADCRSCPLSQREDVRKSNLFGLVHEAAHSDIHHHPERQERKHH
jgi:hypothetical protein